MRSCNLNSLMVVAGLLLMVNAHAQERPGSMGAVTGRVICGDTNAPARMAEVRLEAVKTEAVAGRAGKASDGGVEGTRVQTDLNGEFSFPKVPPGAYFVIIEKEGYLSPRDLFTDAEIQDKLPEMQAIVGRALNRVRVEVGHTEQVSVREERGGAVSGTVLFDDGSPASGISVKVLKKQTGGKWERFGKNSWGDETNDRGSFRVPALPADTYMIEVDLSIRDTKTVTVGAGSENRTEYAIATFRATLPFYGRGSTRQTEAASFTLGAGQELAGEDVTIPLMKLHRLTGVVTAKKDGHKVSAGKVVLAYRDDGKEAASTEVSKEDGVFRFEFVPEGDYVMKTSDARDVVREQTANAPGMFPPVLEKERLLTAYGEVEQPLLLRGEMTDVILQVPEKTAAKTVAATAGGSSEP